VSYGVNQEGVWRFFSEADAVVADAKPQFAGVALQPLDIAFARLRETVESRKDSHGGVAVDPAYIGACGDCKDDLLHAASSQRLGPSPERPNSATMSS